MPRTSPIPHKVYAVNDSLADDHGMSGQRHVINHVGSTVTDSCVVENDEWKHRVGLEGMSWPVTPPHSLGHEADLADLDTDESLAKSGNWSLPDAETSASVYSGLLHRLNSPGQTEDEVFSASSCMSSPPLSPDAPMPAPVSGLSNNFGQLLRQLQPVSTPKNAVRNLIQNRTSGGAIVKDAISRSSATTDLSDETCETPNSMPIIKTGKQKQTRSPNQPLDDDVLNLCQVCSEPAAGFHCGAFVCEACKKFFVRYLKLDKLSKKFTCLQQGHCRITKETRTQCQSCRYQTCVSLGMYKPGTGPINELSQKINNMPCKVCSATSSGYHFGAVTCEGCKGFFRRTIKERTGLHYACYKGNACVINTHTRNACKACRYKKCVHVGMTQYGSRIGRQPNSVKHRALLELTSTKSLVKVEPAEPNVENAMPAVSPLSCAPASTSTAGPTFVQSQLKDALVKKRLQDYFEKIEVPATPACRTTTAEGPQLPAYPTPPTDPCPKVESCLRDPIKTECDESVQPAETVPAANPLPVPSTTTAISNVDLQEALLQASAELDAITSWASNRSTPASDVSVALLWEQHMRHFSRYAQYVLQFCKKVPGFRELEINDQIMKVQMATYPIVLSKLSTSNSCNRCNQTSYNYFTFSTGEQQLLLQHFPGLQVLTSHLHSACEQLQQLHMDDFEVAVLCASLLFTDTTAGEIGSLIRECLATYCRNKVGLSSCRPTHIASCIDFLQQCNLQHQQHVMRIKQQNPQLELPHLTEEDFL